MLPTLVLLTACQLPVGQSERLQLTHVHLTHGNLGPRRADRRFLPGDSLLLAFDIEGVIVDEEGRARYSISLEGSDASGNVRFRQKPQEEEAINALGGRRLPAFVRVDIAPNENAGEYALKVTVTDRTSKQSQTLEERFEVLPADFGLVRLSLTGDVEGEVPAGRLGCGQNVWVNAAVVGFSRKPGGQPNVALQLRILDEDGRPTLARPFQGTINKGVPDRAVLLPIQFALTLNRGGRFTVELQATDQGSGKKARLTFPLVVQDEQ